MSSRDESELLNQVSLTVRSGDKDIALRMICRAFVANPRNESPWRWLSVLVTREPEKEKYCLERVLAIKPSCRIAQHRMARLEAPPIG